MDSAVKEFQVSWDESGKISIIINLENKQTMTVGITKKTALNLIEGLTRAVNAKKKSVH